jgi:cysteine synthase
MSARNSPERKVEDVLSQTTPLPIPASLLELPVPTLAEKLGLLGDRNHPRSALALVGRTPTLELRGIGDKARVFAKLEWCNPGGSVKDRPAKQMVVDAVRQGRLRPGMSIIEATSGNTGTALAYIGAVLDIPVTLVVPEVTSMRKRQDMLRWGANLVVVPGETTELALETTYRMVEKEPELYYHTDQYTNPSNLTAHYLTTGPEILEQVPDVTHVVAAQGSFGTLGGTARFFRERKPDVRIVSVVARPGTTTLFGMKEQDRVMPLVDDSLLNGRMLVGGLDAAHGIQLGLRFGLQLGPSAGAVLAAAIKLARSLSGGTLCCVFADGGGKYPDSALYERSANTDLTADEADREAFVRW